MTTYALTRQVAAAAGLTESKVEAALEALADAAVRDPASFARTWATLLTRAANRLAVAPPGEEARP